MSTLGLSGPPTPQDSLFKRLFWPTVGSVADADLLGQQDFWICSVIAVISLIVNTIGGHWAIALLAAAFFFLGGIGVREHDTFAAVAVAVAYWVEIALKIWSGQFPGILSIVAVMLLTANIRGCMVATRSMETSHGEEMPIRYAETWRDKLVDQMPAKFWPRLKGVFLLVAALYLLLSAAGMWMLIKQGRQALRP